MWVGWVRLPSPWVWARPLRRCQPWPLPTRRVRRVRVRRVRIRRVRRTVSRVAALARPGLIRCRRVRDRVPSRDRVPVRSRRVRRDRVPSRDSFRRNRIRRVRRTVSKVAALARPVPIRCRRVRVRRTRRCARAGWPLRRRRVRRRIPTVIPRMSQIPTVGWLTMNLRVRLAPKAFRTANQLR